MGTAGTYRYSQRLLPTQEDEVKGIIAAAFAGLLLTAGAASAATPTQKIASLQKDVKTLKKTVARQNKSIRLLENALVANFYGDACGLAVATDAVQSTWVAVDQAMGSSVFGPQQTVSDQNSCSALRNPSVVRQGIRTPPTTSVISTMISWFKGPAQRFARFFSALT
jgi:outer membrane murein-binding lipoprotein Lpp